MDWLVGVCSECVMVDFEGGDCFGVLVLWCFSLVSLVLSVVLLFFDVWSLSVNLNCIECVLVYYELFVNGLYVVSVVYEWGDVGLGLECFKGLDFGLKWEGWGSYVYFNFYEMCFVNYVVL